MKYTPTENYKELYELGLDFERNLIQKIDSAYSKISKETKDLGKQFDYIRDNIDSDIEKFESDFIGIYAFRSNSWKIINDSEYFDFSRVFFDKYLSILRYIKDLCS